MKMFLFSPVMVFLTGIRFSQGLSRGFFRVSYSPPQFYTRPFFTHSITGQNMYQLQNKLFSSKRRKLTDSFDTDDIFESPQKKRVIKSFQPKTENQNKFIELMRNTNIDIVIAIGPAGTGKTMLACYAAVEALRLGNVNRIVVTRPVVSVDEEIGFLPGGLESKMDPWTRPIFDTLRESYSAKEIDRMVEEGVIEIVPLGFMRGRTFKQTWIIADEMQNSSPTQMFMLATRIGEGSKMIITGDLNQSDRDIYDNGLREIYEKIRHAESAVGLDCVRYVELEKEDVQRSRAAKRVLDIYSDIDDTVQKILNDAVVPSEAVNDAVEFDEAVNDAVVPSEAVNDAVEFDEAVQGYHEFSGEAETHNASTQEKEWVQLDDAALIPLNHIKQLHGKLI
jgi:phosphate starvation-inducible PhoH-like protein